MNYRKAFLQLDKAVKMPAHSDIEREGLIQRFEYTYELAWNLMKDYLEDKGNVGIQGSKDAIRLAYQNGIIQDGDIWMEMVKSRRLSSYTYDENTAKEIAQAVIDQYYPLFGQLLNYMDNELASNP